MKSKIFKYFTAAVIGCMTFPVWAGHEEAAELPAITIEGQSERMGTIALQPDSGGALDASALLNRVPGGNVTRNGPLTGLPQYRGLFGNRINVMVDGMSLREVGPNSMDTSLSYIPKTMTRSFKVYRGIAPISSGIETLGGTVKTESRRSEFTESSRFETHGLGTLGFSWVNSGKYGGLYTSLANDRHRFHFAGNREKGNDYKFNRNDRLRPSQYDRDSLSLGYGYRWGDQEVFVDWDNKDTGHTGTPSLPLDIVFIRSDVGNFGFKKSFTNGMELNARGFYQHARHDMDNSTVRTPPANPMGFRLIENDLDAGGYKINLLIPEVLSGSLRVGIDGDLAEHNSTVLNPNAAPFFINAFNNADRDRYSVFAEWNGQLADPLSLELGVRYTRVNMKAGRVASALPNLPFVPAPVQTAAQALADRFNDADRKLDDNNINGAAILRYAFNDQLDIEVGAAYKTRSPSYQERFIWIPLETTGGLADGRVYVGDLDLNKEKSYEAELGLDWHTANAYFAPRAFYRYVNDYIQGLPATDALAVAVSNATQPGGPGPLEFSNINAQLYGADLEMGYAFNDYVRLDGILSYVRGKRVGSNNDNNLYRIAPINGRLRLTFNYSGWTLGAEYVGATEQDDVAEFNGEDETSGYSLMNLSAQYQPSYQYLRGLTISAGVDNVFDRKYANHLNGINRAVNEDVALFDRFPNPGRNIYATLSYDW